MHRLRKVEIEKTEKYIAWTDVEGTRHEYERPRRPIQLHVQELRAHQAFQRLPPSDVLGAAGGGPAGEAALTLSFIGTVLLDDHGLEVIGFPETKSRLLSVEFHRQPVEGATGLPVTAVLLGCHFSRKDAENTHGWWLSVLLTPVQFNAVAEAMAARQLAKLALSLELDNLYVREWYATVDGKNGKTNWYLPPDPDPKGGAKVASGSVQALSLETSAMDLRPPAPQEIEAELLKQDTDYRPPPEDKLAQAVSVVAAQVGGLQNVLKFMVVGLLILVFVIGRKF